MATKSIIFDKVTINAVDYSLHLVDSVSVTLESNDDMVDDGQTLSSSYDASFEFDTYQSNIIADTNVNSNASVAPVRSNIVFVGSTGAATLTLSNVFVNAKPTFENNRVAYKVTGSKRGVDSNTVIAVS
jgi:hypothetical protein